MINASPYKTLSGWLLASLFVLLLAACNSTSPPGIGPANPAGTPQPASASGANARPSVTPTLTATPLPSRIKVTPAELKGETVIFWHAWEGPAGKTVESIIAEFNRQNEWGIQAEAVPVGDFDRLVEQMGQLAAAGARPDVVVAYPYQADAWNTPPAVLLDINPYRDDPVWGLDQTDLEDFITFKGNPPNVQDKITGIPAQYSAQLIYYNKTWAAELGFDAAPKTPAEFKKQACAAALAYKVDAIRENDGQGGWIISTSYSTSLGWLHAFGADIAAPNGYSFNTPAAGQAFRFLRELYEQGCAWLPETGYVEDSFTARQGLFATGSVANIPTQEAAFADLGSKDEWVVIPFPSTRGDGVIEVYGPEFYLLKSQPDRQLAAWLLVRWLLQPENQARLAQANAWLPVRTSSLDQMGSLPKIHPQWQAAADLLGMGRREPGLPSWRVVRWALSDAATQLFRSYFTLDQLTPMLELLDDTAAEFQADLK